MLPKSQPCASHVKGLPRDFDHDRRRSIANATIAAAVVDPTQKPRVGSMVDTHGHPPASSFDEQGRFGCLVHRRTAGYHRVAPRRLDGLERWPSS